MSKYDFDTPVDRRGTGSIKWDQMPGGSSGDVLPMWVADMDFPTAPAVRQALRERVDHGIFGYTQMTDEDWETVIGWYRDRHGLELRRQWLMPSPGVVASIRAAVDLLAQPGQPVVIQTPVYSPFFNVVRYLGRRLVENPLVSDDSGYYRMDLEHLEQCFRDGARVMIFCSPHNPVGRVWTHEELSELSALCTRYGVTVVSDEIHCDIILPEHRHIPLMTIPGMEQRTIALHSVTKTFNLGGIQISTVVSPSEEIRRGMSERLWRFGLGGPNLMAIIAQTAAYRHGGPWTDALIAYIDGNVSLMDAALREAGLPCRRPEGTYLMWVDCSALGVTGDDLVTLFAGKAGIALTNGAGFGMADHVRINVATPRVYVERAANGILRMMAERQGGYSSPE